MGLRIKTNIASLKTQRNLAESTEALNQSTERLASGQRINKAADDAAGLAVSEHLRTVIRSMGQANRNANDGVSLIQVAEGSIAEVSNILVRLRELSTQAASDTIGNKERAFINKEYNELVSEIDRIGNVAEYNGMKLFKGVPENLVIHVGPGDGTEENKDTISLNLQNMRLSTTEDLGLEKGAMIGPEDPLGELDGFKRETAAEKLQIIDRALSKVSSIRAELGSKQSRLTTTIANLAIAFESLSASNSRIRDVDFALETANYTQNRILQQGGASVLSQANSMPELALTLLRQG